MTRDILHYQSYLLVIPHPDDEINCAALLHRILQQGKKLHVVLVTNGSNGESASLRAEEMKRSLQAIGIKPDHFRELGIGENELLTSFPQVLSSLREIVDQMKPDCLLTLDFEGGHEGHDATNLLAHLAISNSDTRHIVFPDTHFRDMTRHGMEFLPNRHPDYVIELTEEEKDLKVALLQAHAGQIGSYLRVQKVQPDYFNLLFAREVYRSFPKEFNYLDHPTYQIAYEYHRNGFKFEDYQKAAKLILQE